jgi:hypothetical protein
MSNPLIEGKDLGNITVPVPASAYVTATAGGAGDNTAVVGLTIDRATLTPFGAGNTLTNVIPTGAVFEVFYECVLAAAATVSIKNVKVEDSADGTTWATVLDQTGVAGPIPPSWPVAGVIDTGGTGGSTQRGVVAFGTDIKRCRRYVRFDWTPDLSATSVDTGKFTVTAVLSGIDEVPPGVV